MPIVNNDGKVSLATEVNDNIPGYHLAKSLSGPAG